MFNFLQEILWNNILAQVCAFALTLTLIYREFMLAQNAFFHPLSKFPGSKIAAVSDIPYLTAQLQGRLPQWLKQQHDWYGGEGDDIVRVRPNGLSFIGEAAWRDMFTHRYGKAKFQKDSVVYAKNPGDVDSVLTANDIDHTRMRALMAHGFSGEALKAQEPTIQAYVRCFVEQLKLQVTQSSTKDVDISQWLSWVTFDIIGDLSMGQAFHSLTDRENHPWLTYMSQTFKFLSFKSAFYQLGIPRIFMALFFPKNLLEQRLSHLQSISEKVDSRLKETPNRADILSYIVRHNGSGKGMSIPELKANTSLFVGAGNFSTATVLCGTIYHLCQSPKALEKAKNEIRGLLTSEQDITMERTGSLPYLQAIINESHRIYPAALGGSPHIVPEGGAIVCGQNIPSGTRVTINQWAVNQSSQNLVRPNEFLPERWLDPTPAEFANDKRDAVQPFSVGPRNCIGKNIANVEHQLILAHLLWHFDFGPSQQPGRFDIDWPDQKVYLRWQKKPLYVEVAPRI